MPLHIIIDGYNMIRGSDRLSALDNRDLQHGRDGLLASLQAYHRKKRHRITVVFDAADAPGQVRRKTIQNGVEIRFSPKGVSADAVIMNMARREKEKALVVSSDREVADFSSSHGSAVLSSSAFEHRMFEVEIDGFEGEDDDVYEGWKPTTKKKGPKRRPSKRMRKNRLKTRKL